MCPDQHAMLRADRRPLWSAQPDVAPSVVCPRPARACVMPTGVCSDRRSQMSRRASCVPNQRGHASCRPASVLTGAARCRAERPEVPDRRRRASCRPVSVLTGAGLGADARQVLTRTGRSQPTACLLSAQTHASRRTGCDSERSQPPTERRVSSPGQQRHAHRRGGSACQRRASPPLCRRRSRLGPVSTPDGVHASEVAARPAPRTPVGSQCARPDVTVTVHSICGDHGWPGVTVTARDPVGRCICPQGCRRAKIHRSAR